MPWHLKTEGDQVLVVRDRDQKVVGRHKDRKKATAQLKVLYSLEKAQFASRTEAARYAANQRWKNHTPKEKADATAPGDLKIVEIRGNETFGPYKDGTFTRRATFTVLDDEGKEMWVDVTAKGVKGSQFIEVEAKRGKKQIGYLWAETDHDGRFGRKGKIAIGQVDVVANERRKGVATALMRLGKRYNIGSETIYHSTILTTDGGAFAEDTEIEKGRFASRSEAGRYAANQRWQGHKKEETTGSKPTKDAIVKSFPLMMKVNSVPWAKGDSSHFEMLVEEGVSEKSAKLATSDNITLGDYADPAVAAGNCGIASADVGAFLIRAGIAKEGEVFMREVGEPAYGDMGGTHFVTHIGPKDSPDAIIVDFTLRQFDPDADFPWVGTVQQYRETGYETDDIVGPELGTDMDPIDASGNVLYPGYEKLTSK